jgi:hypothetical protein
VLAEPSQEQRARILHSEKRANLLLDKGRNFAGFSERALSEKANWSDLQTVA